MSRTLCLWLCACAVSAAAFAAAADAIAPEPTPSEAVQGMRPLWELGAGFSAGAVADYPSSDRYRFRGLPYPYFVYRGAFLRSDEAGTRVRASWRQNIEFSISADASFASNSDGNGPRAGMPNLEYLFEIGPKVNITIARPAPHTHLVLELPARSVISTNFARRFDHDGWVSTPDIALRSDSVLGTRWRGSLLVGPEFGDSRFAAYFYGVSPEYATPERPAYDAHGGYIGSRLDLSVSCELTHSLRFFMDSEFNDYSGSANRDSPLFITKTGGSVFAGFSWIIKRSRQSVAVPR
jgi:outer membrane scaffolding protein for murein synthesis (MipA/OmpV family)